MIRSFVFLTVFAFASGAFAQAYDRNGPALGAGVGFAIEDFDDGGIDFDNSGVAGATFSYRVHPHIGLEGRFEHTFNFDGNAPFNDVDVDIWNLTANGADLHPDRPIPALLRARLRRRPGRGRRPRTVRRQRHHAPMRSDASVSVSTAT